MLLRVLGAKFNNVHDKYSYNDAPGYKQFNIPSGMKSAYISHLQWSSGGYADVYGVQSDGGLVFLKRINTHQAVENTNEGNPDQHDGMTITFAGSGLHTYSDIRLVNKSGRFHLTGLGFVPHLDGAEGTGMIHANQITQASALGFAPTASPSFTGQVYSSGAFYTDGNRSVICGEYPTLYFTDTENGQRSGMIHMNDSRMYFLSGGTDSETWVKTANDRWPLYLQTDTNAAVFGGDIDASAGTLTAGAINCSGTVNTGYLTSVLMNMGDYAVGQGYMAPRTLTLGSTSANYGGGNSWNTNTAAILLECADNTEIAVNDGGTRVASLMYYQGGSNRITIGRNMGWGTTKTKFDGFVGINKNPDYGYPLDVSGTAKADQIISNGGYFTVGSSLGNATVVKHGGLLVMGISSPGEGSSLNDFLAILFGHQRRTTTQR
jgi:hypothetical protein